MSVANVATHYAQRGLLGAIRAGLKAVGAARPDDVRAALGACDEFHVGGAQATAVLLERLAVHTKDGNDRETVRAVLDVGAGIGGAARSVAATYGPGCRVIGVDLTPEYVETGNALNALCGMGPERGHLVEGSALDLGTALTEVDDDDNEATSQMLFDQAIMLHVGMNIADKRTLFREVASRLRPGGCFGVYDLMRTDDAVAWEYPLPWASAPEHNNISPLPEYLNAAEQAGLEVVETEDRTAFADEFFATMQRAREQAEAEGQVPSPLGVHLLMGEDFPNKMVNVQQVIGSRRAAPTILIAQRPA